MERRLSDGGRWKDGAAGGSCYRHPLLWCWSNLRWPGWAYPSHCCTLLPRQFPDVFPLTCCLSSSQDPSLFIGLFACMVNRLLKIGGWYTKSNGDIQSTFCIFCKWLSYSSERHHFHFNIRNNIYLKPHWLLSRRECLKIWFWIPNRATFKRPIRRSKGENTHSAWGLWETATRILWLDWSASSLV